MYRAVLIYNNDTGDFLGRSIKADGALKLQTTNIYVEGEEGQLAQQLARLNENMTLKAAWPDTRDPDVQRLLQDPNFMPLEMHEAQVVDDANSYYVYHEEDELDVLNGQPTGAKIQGELNEEASVIVFTKAMVPVRPSDELERVKAACERIARQRSA